MLHRIRKCFKTKKIRLRNIVEADEFYSGGRNKSRHKNKRDKGTQGRSTKHKTPIFGMRERGGNMIAYVVKDTTANTLIPLIKENVELDTHIMTDEWGAYNSLYKDYKHSRVKHKSGQYVDGIVYTNSIEGCWALLRRGFIGTYHQMSRKHLQSYVDEFVFRNDTRSYTEQERFDFFFNNMENRLRYKNLVQHC